MQIVLRSFLAAVFSCAVLGSASAQWRHPPHCYPVAPGFVLKTSQYQQPDGSYDSLSDFVRDVNGTPCGLDCPAPSRVIMATPPSYYCTPD